MNFQFHCGLTKRQTSDVFPDTYLFLSIPLWINLIVGAVTVSIVSGVFQFHCGLTLKSGLKQFNQFKKLSIPLWINLKTFYFVYSVEGKGTFNSIVD